MDRYESIAFVWLVIGPFVSTGWLLFEEMRLDRLTRESLVLQDRLVNTNNTQE